MESLSKKVNELIYLWYTSHQKIALLAFGAEIPKIRILIWLHNIKLNYSYLLALLTMERIEIKNACIFQYE